MWLLVKDGDDICRGIFHSHYSHRKYRDGRKPKLFVGPGRKMVLVTAGNDALFVWRKFIDKCIDARTNKPQSGVNCSVFRNESRNVASEMILEAEWHANRRWAHERLYTYVDPKKVKSRNPGYCFICAGWKKCGVTKSGLLIFEKCVKPETV